MCFISFVLRPMFSETSSSLFWGLCSNQQIDLDAELKRVYGRTIHKINKPTTIKFYIFLVVGISFSQRWDVLFRRWFTFMLLGCPMCLYNDSRVQSYILTTSKQHTNYEKVRPEKMKLDELQIHLWSVDLFFDMFIWFFIH